MSARSVDTVQERGRVVNALVATSTTTPSSPWRGSTSEHNKRRQRGDHTSYHHYRDGAADDRATPNPLGCKSTLDDDDDDLVGAVDKLLSSGRGQGPEGEDGLDLCSSTWKSVEVMARALAVGQSVLSTISRCYSLPDLGRDSGRRRVAAYARRSRQARTEAMHTSLLSGRFAAKALAVFRSLGQAPPTQPDSLYISSSKLPEAAKALDPGLDDATIRSWMRANGFEQQGGKASENHEALSWTEYCQALSGLSPAFRRHGVSTISGERTAAVGTMPIETNRSGCRSRRHAGGPPSPNNSVLAGESYRDPWDDAFDRTTACASPPRQHSSSWNDGGSRNFRDGVGGYPPRSPGADSYGVLRRKRHAAVSLDYEVITKHLPQVMPPLDPSILVDHIKAQGRRERKDPGSEFGDSSLWTLDPHERLLKMSLQKDKVSETANPRLLQPRHAAVKLRSRRLKFGRRREAEAGLMSRLARNAGVICRQAKIAEAKQIGRERLSADQERVESQRVAETNRSLLVRAGAKHRASERRLKMEMLKSCIADQLRTIQENEERAMDRVRKSKHVLRKGEGIEKKIESLKRVRSSPTLQRSQVSEPAREPYLTPTVPTPDQDARWIYSSGNPLQHRQGRGPLATHKPQQPQQQLHPPRTITLSNLAMEKSFSEPAVGSKATAAAAGVSVPPRRAGGGGTVGKCASTGVGRGDGKDGTGVADEDEKVDWAIALPLFSADGPAPSLAERHLGSGHGQDPAARRKRLPSRETLAPTRRGEVDGNNIRWFSSMDEARFKTRGRASCPAAAATRPRGGGAVHRPSPRRDPKTAGVRVGSLGRTGATFESASSPLVSPWGRQAASPVEWGGVGRGRALCKI